MNFRHFCLLLIILAFFMPDEILAQKKLILRDPQITYTVDSNYFENIEWKEKSSYDSIHALPNKTLFLSNPDISKEYWAKIIITNANSEISDWILVSYFYSIDEIDLIIKDSIGNIEKQYFRDTMSIYSREIQHKQPSFALSIKPFETKTLYIKIKNESTYEYNFGIFSHFHFFTNYFREYLLVGLFYGLMLFVFIYSLINYIFFRDNVVLIYLFFILSQTIHMLFRDGNGLYVLPAFTEYADLIKNLSRASISVFILIYTLSFLKIKRSDLSYKLVVVFILARILYAAFMLGNTSLLTFHFELFAILISTFLSVKSFLEKDVEAKYMAVGFSLMSISYFVFYLSVVWFSSLGTLGYFIMYFGIAAESIFTTLALTERFKRIRLDNYKKDQMNKELEKTVTQRTELISMQNKILEEQSSELNSFLYSASHDLKGPLKSIEGLINLGMIDPEVDHKQIYRLMSEKLFTLEENISDLYNVTIIKNNGKDLGIIDFDKIHAETLEKYSQQISHSKILVQYRSGIAKPYKGDLFPVKIIYQHIVGNAIKFIDPDKDSYLKIRITENERQYNLSFEDNGVGIREEILSSIFNMFYRGNENSRNDTGLGLYMVKLAVKKLNGEIEVKSVFGQGSSFSVTIPKT
jgi:signal transduction histidine kinase